MKIFRLIPISFVLAASLVLSSCGGSSGGGLNVTTFAGVLGSYGGLDGLPADDPDVGPALFGAAAYGIASDGTNLYIADSSNNTVRKMNIASRIVITLAGTAGSSGSTDGMGSAARFTYPWSLATDGTNLYVVDGGNSTIRKIVIATGEVTTLAGSPGSTGNVDGTGAGARFNSPLSIVLNGSDLYVLDFGNSAIRRVDTATGDVTTFATGIAVGYLNQMACDGSSIFIADNTQNKILKIDLGTASVTTLAGTGASGSNDGPGSTATFYSPSAVATDGTYVYVSDAALIRRINIATTEVTTLAGTFGSSPLAPRVYVDEAGSAARFSGNETNLVTAGGNLYILDGSTIRRLNLAGNGVTTFAGAGPFGFVSGSTDGAGTGPGQFYHPFGITRDGTSLYVTDWQTNTVRKIDIATRLTTTLAGLAGPTKGAYDDSSLYSGTADGVGSAARFNFPFGITTSSGYLYVIDGGNFTIRRISIATDEVTTLAGSPGVSTMIDDYGTAAGFAFPQFITTDGTDLYVSDSGKLRKIVIATGQVTTLTTPFVNVLGMSIIGRNLYVADAGDKTIQVLDLDTNGVTALAGSSGNAGTADGIGSAARFTTLQGMTNDGINLYVADGNAVRKLVIATGTVTTLTGDVNMSGTADGAASAARFNTPVDIAWDGTSLYVTDSGSGRIRRIK